MGINNSGSIIGGSLWMLFISILLFWLPILGPLLAGIVGGMKSGGVGSAIIAVFLPGIVVGLLLAFLPVASLGGLPVIGALLAAAFAFGAIFIGLQIGLLLLGAIIGGIIG